MIVVTGGAGFIGSNLVRGLNRLGVDEIVVVDHLGGGDKFLNLTGLAFADVIGVEQLFDWDFSRVRAVFHEGACTDTSNSDGDSMIRQNYEYSKRLLARCEQHATRFIYASSASIYGSGAQGFREEPVCDSPLNVYAFSKATFDNYVRRRLDSSPSAITGLRYFNVYGPGERHKRHMASIAQQLFDQLTVSGKMRLFEGSDEFRRDFVHVDDVVAVNLWFLESGVRGIYNCGTGHARPISDLARHLLTRHGSGEIEMVGFPAHLRNRYQEFTEADLTRLRAAGYVQPFKSLEAGLDAYYDWLRATSDERDPQA
jgi:ADP-L-glycero-D-manno-heptose 6-epimerase